MTVPLSDAAKALLDEPEFACMATIEPDGQPQLSVVWIGREGDEVVVSTIKGRRKFTNMLRDPRVTVLIFPKDRPYSYLEIRGTATMTEDGGPELIDRFAREYRGTERYTGDDGTDHVRVVVRITPTRVVTRD
jgi:PPOX class probable F420-dependent enzyme